MMNDTKNETSFRTADDLEKLRRAEKVSARHDELVASAKSTLASAEAACAEEPSDANMKRAKEARRALEDAEQGRELAQSHAARVSAEVAAAEARAISKEIARLAASMTEVADDTACEVAVDLALRMTELRMRTDARCAQRIAEIKELNLLRAKIGDAAEDVPSTEQVLREGIAKLAELGLSAQAQLGVKNQIAHAGGIHQFLPAWRSGSGASDPKEFAPGIPVAFRSDDDHDRICGTARTLLERAKASRPATERSKGGLATVAAGVATAALGALAALTIAGGG